ncbi:esterase-like activity of phytase family protein [Streptomyces sp. 049-1]|uniref:esterase-like activity of phytase family protein n=1 Tax=Streptomyces sp. 049-1 TaxID=2789264 RepID=UPI003980E0FF
MNWKSVTAISTAVAAATETLPATGPVHAQPQPEGGSQEVWGIGQFSPAIKINSFSDKLDKATFNGNFAGNFSALTPAAHGTLEALSDRSSLFTITGRHHDDLRPTNVVQLKDENGHPLDSEAFVIDREGTRVITSETEPSICRFSRDSSTVLASLPVPAELKVTPAGRATANLIFEGLALQPGGHTLVASTEGALAGDDSTTVRFQTWHHDIDEQEFKLCRQYAYHVDSDAHRLNGP